jgi:DNA-binding SARP family transcriptional activator
MLRLLTFGGLRVVRDDGSTTELSNQRRRLAVLAVAAAAAPAGIAREKLLFLLWPDADADKGRHALNQIVYNLRRELGTSPIDGVTELALLPDVMSADLLDFRAAVARGDHAGAAALYSGPFLDGFFVPGAGEFERWAEEERARTTRQAIGSLDKLATAASADPVEQARWTGRLVELDPLSARRALAHMRALEQSGDRDAAVAYGRRYDALAKADGDDVDPAVNAEVERLRALPTIVPLAIAQAPLAATPIPPAVISPAVIPPAVTPQAVMLSAESPQLDGEGVTAPAITLTSARSTERDAPRDSTRSFAHARRRSRIASVLVAASAAALAAIAWSRAQQSALALGIGDRILVADVQVPAADSANARAIALALHSALHQSARVRLVSPASISDALQRMKRPNADNTLSDSTALEVAEREGARYVVSLTVVPTGTARLLTLRVFDPASQNAVRTYSATATGDALLAALDDLTSQLRRDLGDSPRELASTVPLPRATTTSLEALRLLASGRDAFNRSLYNDARALYMNAIALDSGFAAAHAGAAAVEYALNNIREGDTQIAKALALSDRLPPRERLLIQAEAERGRGDWFRAAVLHRAYLIRYPDDYDVYEMLGYDLAKGRNPDEAIIAYDTVRAHRRLSATALMEIGQINILLGRWADARAAFADGVHQDTTFIIRNVENERIGATLMRLGFNDSARVVFNLMLQRDERDQARGHRSLAYVDLHEGRYRSAVEHLRAAIELGQKQDGGGTSEIRDRALLTNALIDLGQVTAAREQLRAAARVALSAPFDPAVLFFAGKPAARIGDTLTVQQLLDSAKVRTRETDIRQVSATTGLEAELLLARGRITDGVAMAERAVSVDSAAYLVETLAYALERAGKLLEARAKYETLARGVQRQMGKEAQQVCLLAPLAMARIDAQVGRAADAQRVVSQFSERWSTADPNLPMITTLRARITAQLRNGTTSDTSR